MKIGAWKQALQVYQQALEDCHQWLDPQTSVHDQIAAQIHSACADIYLSRSPGLDVSLHMLQALFHIHKMHNRKEELAQLAEQAAKNADLIGKEEKWNYAIKFYDIAISSQSAIQTLTDSEYRCLSRYAYQRAMAYQHLDNLAKTEHDLALASGFRQKIIQKNDKDYGFLAALYLQQALKESNRGRSREANIHYQHSCENKKQITHMTLEYSIYYMSLLEELLQSEFEKKGALQPQILNQEVNNQQNQTNDLRQVSSGKYIPYSGSSLMRPHVIPFEDGSNQWPIILEHSNGVEENEPEGSSLSNLRKL